MVMIPNGTRDVIKTLNVNISTLRGAIEIVDPSLERALDIESDYECLMIVKLTSNYLISKGRFLIHYDVTGLKHLSLLLT